MVWDSGLLDTSLSEFTAMVMTALCTTIRSASAARHARKVSPRVKSLSSEHRSVQGRARVVCVWGGCACVFCYVYTCVRQDLVPLLGELPETLGLVC